jgi:hypothetical protein
MNRDEELKRKLEAFDLDLREQMERNRARKRARRLRSLSLCVFRCSEMVRAKRAKRDSAKLAFDHAQAKLALAETALQSAIDTEQSWQSAHDRLKATVETV